MRSVRISGPAALGAAVLLLLSSASAFAETWYVGAGSDCFSHSIQAAVDAAAQSQTTEQKIIDISSDQDYSAQSIHVDTQDLTFFGGRLACSSLFTSDATIISGDGASGPVFNITGTSHITFYNFEIRDGNAFTGGGINFSGNGSLVLSSILIDFNTATYGGGVAAASNGALDIYVDPETLILRNTAQNAGGGVELSGNTYFYAMQPDTLIGYNSATGGSGGGIDAVAPAQVTLGSPGYHGLPVVFDNNAAYGGGIALSGSEHPSDIGQILIFATDPASPVQVNDNVASVAGGGVYLLGKSGLVDARMCAQDFRFNENVAPQGAAIQLDWTTADFGTDEGSDAFLNPDDSCDLEGLGAAHCAAGVPCNEMSGNVARDSNDNPSGAVVFVGTSSKFSAQRVSMRDNVGNNLILTQGDNDYDGDVYLRACLTANNQFARELIHVQNDDNTLYIDQCTFAPDIINSSYVILFDNAGGNSITMINTIIDEPGTLSLAQPGINQSIENILTNDDSTLPSHPDIVLGTPLFVDEANGNYRQQPASLGVDFAIATGGIDLDGNRRDVDLPETPNFFGPRDLGAYETQQVFACGVNDTIFCDGFDGS